MEFQSKNKWSSFEIKGEADLKNVSKIDKNRILKDLPYKFILSLKDFKYEYPKVAKVKCKCRKYAYKQ